jgi:acetyltransferase-like isoleucine patch superfamily enzyme
MGDAPVLASSLSKGPMTASPKLNAILVIMLGTVAATGKPRGGSGRRSGRQARLEVLRTDASEVQAEETDLGRFHKAARYWRSLPYSLYLAVAGARTSVVFLEGKSPLYCRAGRVVIGRRLLFKTRQVRSEFGATKGGYLLIGDRVFINQGCKIVAQKFISIGDDCLIGDFTSILDSNEHEVAPNSGVRKEPVTIGRNVWIGRNSVLLPGIDIGDNSVIGAGSIVTQNIPANSLAAGNPARVIREIAVQPGWVRR